MRSGDVLAERFVLEERAGSGGMGTVFRAADRKTGLPVAVKVLRDHQGDDARRFDREARLLAELSHPRIVRHVAHGVTNEGEPWLAMEWLSGEDLGQRLSRGPLRVDESVKVALAVAEGLGFAHGLSVVHRDLKPSNVFLVDGGIQNVKLLDFGIARRGAGSRVTRTGMLLGTPGYMSPEQARGGSQVSPQADVYSLGCVLYECLTGEPLFVGEHAVALLVKALFDETPRVRDRLGGLSGALCDLLERMLSKDPAARPRDGAEVARVLASLLDDVPATLASLVPPSLASSKALTDSEQKSVAVILVGPSETDDPAVDEALRSEAERHGGHVEVLQDGTLSVVLTGTTSLPTDLAAQSARTALSLRAHAPDRPLVVSMGRVDVTGRLPMGQVIDRAAQMLGGQSIRATSVPVVLDDVVAGLLDARFDVREETGSFVLRGEHALAEGTRMLLGKATPCVGRERELRVMEQLFEDCVEEGTAQVVLVTAPAGTGKSRLGQEFLRVARDRAGHLSIWIGRGDSLRAGSPLGLLSQALRGASGVLEGEPIEVRRDKVRAAVAARVAEKDQKRISDFLGEIVGAPFPDEDNLPLRAARADAQLMGDQMRSAFVDFLAAECERGPVVILLEDLHWGDRATVQFLDHALKELEEKPLFVLSLARPEVVDVFPKLWVQRRQQEVRLPQLPRKAIERLARHVLGERATAEMIDRVARLSEGNAFYLEELLRWAAEGKSGELPQTVVAMVQARLGALDDESRRLLRAASVFGEVFWPGAVASLLGGAAVHERIANLVSRELLLKRPESRFPGEEEFSFRHALLREGAYGMLTDADRGLGHKLAGEWLEAKGETDALLLAEHFEKGGEGEKAGRHYLRATQQADWGGDTLAAIACAQRGLSAGASPDVRVELLGVVCELHYFNLEIVRDALTHAEELVHAAPAGSAPWCRGMLVALVCAMLDGRMGEWLARLRETVAVEPSREAAGAICLALTTSVYVLDALVMISEADAMLNRMEEVARAFGNDAPMSRFLFECMKGIRTAWVHEDPACAVEQFELSLGVAESIGHVRFRNIVKYVLLGMARWLLGRWEEAERALLGSPVADEEIGFGMSFRPFSLAWSMADRGALDEALQWANRLVTGGRACSAPIDEGRGRWVLAEVLRRRGELAQAETEIDVSIALVAMACPIDLPGTKATLAAIRLAKGNADEALAAAEEALSLYESTGACSFFMRGAFLRLVHIECLEAAGRHEDACKALAEAKRRLLRNADKIDDPAYRKSFLENVPENRKTLELSRQWLGEDA